VTQKEMPSLQAPNGAEVSPRLTEPSGDRLVALQRETVSPFGLVTRIRCPSKAAALGAFKSFPVRVANTTPLEARTTETEADPLLGTQMFVPSKMGCLGEEPTVEVTRIPPFPSSFRSVPAVLSVIHTFEPS